MFPKTEYLLQCPRGIQAQFSGAAMPDNTPNIYQEFPEVFLLQKPI
jgi:hypothetical protein